MELIRDAALPKVIVTYPEALIEGVVEAEAYEAGRLELRVGAQMDRKALREKLWEMGFEEKDYVYAPGDFAVRGSIIDIYSFAAEYPARLDFFDDELESIRLFEPESQLSQEQIGEITILSSFKPEERAGHSLISLLPKDTLIYVDQAAFLPDSLQTTYTTAPIHPEDNQFATLQDLQASLVEPTSLLAEIDEHQCLLTNPKVAEKVVRFGQLPEPIFHKNFDLLSEALLKYQSSGYDTIIMSDQEGQIERLQSIFSEQAKGVVFQPLPHTTQWFYR